MGVSSSPTYLSTKLITNQAQGELLSPYQFYNLCKEQLQAQQRLYFLSPSPHLLDLHSRINEEVFLLFCDYLANYLRSPNLNNRRIVFYLEETMIIVNGKKIATTRVKHSNSNFLKNLPLKTKVVVEIVGSGMVGRVAKVRVNNGQEFAFKAFFDPDFIWHHGPWGEIPIGIYLTSNQVTKDVAKFYFAGQSWAVWEWVNGEENPRTRKGIAYEEFAEQQGLTKLNPLNRNNYNPHNIRLDLGGIQKKTWLRYGHNFFQGARFYFRRGKREGFSSLLIYLQPKNVRYLCLRLIREICPGHFLLK